MARAETPVCDFDRPAPDFTLPSVDGALVTLDDVMGPKGALIMFICNHCPYVVGAIERIVDAAWDVQGLGFGVAAICSNDADAYPDDSFPNMKLFALQNWFSFPYLHDADQLIARAYGAVCTPDFFGYNAQGALQYRGRLDSAGPKPVGPETTPDLVRAMTQIAETGRGPADQIASMGCSIKWKPA